MQGQRRSKVNHLQPLCPQSDGLPHDLQVTHDKGVGEKRWMLLPRFDDDFRANARRIAHGQRYP
jgi:hypothetical protein